MAGTLRKVALQVLLCKQLKNFGGCNVAWLRYFDGMVAKQHIPEEFTVPQMRLLSEQFNAWGKQFGEAADKCEALKTDRIYAFNSSSLQKGIVLVTAFMAELSKSSASLIAGKPITAETRKARTKKTSEDLGRAIAAEAKDKYQRGKKK